MVGTDLFHRGKTGEKAVRNSVDKAEKPVRVVMEEPKRPYEHNHILFMFCGTLMRSVDTVFARRVV